MLPYLHYRSTNIGENRKDVAESCWFDLQPCGLHNP